MLASRFMKVDSIRSSPIFIHYKTISRARLIFQRLHTMRDKFSRRAQGEARLLSAHKKVTNQVYLRVLHATRPKVPRLKIPLTRFKSGSGRRYSGPAERKKRNIRKTQEARGRSGGGPATQRNMRQGEATRARGGGEEKETAGGERVESFTGDYYGRIAKRCTARAVSR